MHLLQYRVYLLLPALMEHFDFYLAVDLLKNVALKRRRLAQLLSVFDGAQMVVQ
jgi:type III secretory pathway lipoprotein EscJ